MTSHKLVFAILIPCLLNLHIPQSLASSGDSDEFKDDSHKVKLSLYYEALCPFCTNFIVNNLAKIFENGLISVVDLRLVPWGNAFVKDKNTWVCQVSLYFHLCRPDFVMLLI